jgi:hypothetical protein
MVFYFNLMRYIEINNTTESNRTEKSLDPSADQYIYIYIYKVPKLKINVSFFFCQYTKSISQDHFTWLGCITTLIFVPLLLQNFSVRKGTVC